MDRSVLLLLFHIKIWTYFYRLATLAAAVQTAGEKYQRHFRQTDCLRAVKLLPLLSTAD